MSGVITASMGLALGGFPGALLGLGLHVVISWRKQPRLQSDPIRPILVLLLVELRSGRSALGALQAVADSHPSRLDVVRVARVATVSGLTAAVEMASGPLRHVVSQLARAHRSGAPLADTVRAMIEADVAAEKAARVARARTVPVRLMIPITLLLLPGLVLLFYAPSMLRLFDELSGQLS